MFTPVPVWYYRYRCLHINITEPVQRSYALLRLPVLFLLPVLLPLILLPLLLLPLRLLPHTGTSSTPSEFVMLPVLRSPSSTSSYTYCTVGTGTATLLCGTTTWYWYKYRLVLFFVYPSETRMTIRLTVYCLSFL
jgi:hypothetical protein